MGENLKPIHRGGAILQSVLDSVATLSHTFIKLLDCGTRRLKLLAIFHHTFTFLRIPCAPLETRRRQARADATSITILDKV